MGPEVIAAIVGAVGAYVARYLAKLWRARRHRRLNVTSPDRGIESIVVASNASEDDIRLAVQRALDFEALVRGHLERLSARSGSVTEVRRGRAVDFVAQVGDRIIAI